MHWDGYTVCSVLSGAILVLLGLAPIAASLKDRLRIIVGGAVFVAYGIYVASQTSGFFVFSPAIFVIPVLAIAYVVILAVKNLMDGSAPASGMATGRGAGGASSAVATSRVQRRSADLRPDVKRAVGADLSPTKPSPAMASVALAEAPTVYCEECGAGLRTLAKFCSGCGHQQPGMNISH